MAVLDGLREELFVLCTNCAGRGHHGRLVSSVFNSRDIGKTVACDVCGGTDDRLGHGVVLNYDADQSTILELLSQAEAQRALLLAACEAALRSLGFYLDFHHQPHSDYGGMQACKMLHAAIAKAKGEQDDV